MNNANAIYYASLKAFIRKLASLQPMFIAVRGCKWHFLGTEIWRWWVRRPYSQAGWPQTAWLEFMEPFAHSLVSYSMQSKNLLAARNINLKYFTFNCCKRQTLDGKMCRWACSSTMRGLLHIPPSTKHQTTNCCTEHIAQSTKLTGHSTKHTCSTKVGIAAHLSGALVLHWCWCWCMNMEAKKKN